jgi:hypothetical protein
VPSLPSATPTLHSLFLSLSYLLQPTLPDLIYYALSLSLPLCSLCLHGYLCVVNTCSSVCVGKRSINGEDRTIKYFWGNLSTSLYRWNCQMALESAFTATPICHPNSTLTFSLPLYALSLSLSLSLCVHCVCVGQCGYLRNSKRLHFDIKHQNNVSF